MQQLIVTCSRPGMIRGGQRNPAAAAYPLDHFSPDQLDDLFGDPHITVAVGTLVSAASDGTDLAVRHAALELKRRTLTELLVLAGPRTFDSTADTIVTDPAVVHADELTGKTVQAAAAADAPIGATIDPLVPAVLAGEVAMDPAHRAVRARGRA